MDERTTMDGAVEGLWEAGQRVRAVRNRTRAAGLTLAPCRACGAGLRTGEYRDPPPGFGPTS